MMESAEQYFSTLMKSRRANSQLVHAVDEGEIQGLAVQLGIHIGLLKKFVAGLCEHPLTGSQRLLQARVRIDSQRERFGPDDFEGEASIDADLKVGGRLQVFMNASQNAEIVLARELHFRQHAVRSDMRH